MTGYKSPIEIIYGQMRVEQENNIIKAVQDYGVSVDKEELVRALNYDRKQYKEGFADGVKEFAEILKKEMQNLARMNFECTPYFLLSEAFIDELAKRLGKD